MTQPPTLAEPLVLTKDAAHCELFPQVGGSLGGWSVQGQQMLREAAAASIEARNPFGMASFPLVPYSNRIANGRFEWDGSTILLERNFPPEPHSIHGVGFERPWQVHSRTADSALLTLIHQPDAGWPWPFEARQRVTLAEWELTLDLIAVNTAARPVPLAFGIHPYFPQSGASLSFTASAVWLAGEDGLPLERVEPHGKFDFSRPMSVERVDLDNCYTGWSEPACITWAGKPLGLEVSASRSLPAAVVYIRRDAQGFCFEPVAHINNVLNLPGRQPAMPLIAPGAAFRATVRLRAVPRDAAVRRSPGEPG